MNDFTLQPYMYGEQAVRVLTIDGEPRFVLNDLCLALGISNPRNVANRLDPDSRGVHSIDTLGGRQAMTTVTEGGMYEVIIRSDSPAAKPFRRWVTHEVLPQIRKTGSYSTQPVLSGPELLARAVIEAHATIEAAHAEIRQLEPRAQAWDSFLGSTGDYSVNEAAKVLSRDKNIHIGEGRLRALLEEWRWIYRHSGKPRAMQTQIDNGRLTEKASFYYHPETGEKVAKTPQVRITPKGLDAIAKRMLEVAA